MAGVVYDGQAREHVAELGEGIQARPFGTAGEAEEDRGGAAASVIAAEEAILAADRARLRGTID